LKAGKKPATLVIVSDADMLADNFYVQRRNFFGIKVSEMFNDNLNFLSNSGDAHRKRRSHRASVERKIDRPFTAVLALRKKAKAQWMDKEKELVKQIEETNRKLQQLESEKDASQKMIISPEQEAEVRQIQGAETAHQPSVEAGSKEPARGYRNPGRHPQGDQHFSDAAIGQHRGHLFCCLSTKEIEEKMNKKTIFILLVVLAVLAGVGRSILVRNSNTPGETDLMGSPLFETLPANEIAQIIIDRPGDAWCWHERRRGWIVKNRFGYPADFSKITDLIRK
jgi:hypothetical protein